MNADQAKQLNEIHARVFGRDVQRWMHPNSGEVSFDNKPGWIPCRSTDIHDILSTNNLVTSQTNKVLDVVSKIPGVDPKLISELRTQLSEELKLATSNLTITLKTD